MKRLTKNQHCAFFIAAMLSICTPAWAATSTEDKEPDAAGLMHQAQRLNDEGLLAEAAVAALASMEAARRKGSVLDFTDLDAGFLLVNLLHRQGKYSEARGAAEEQIAYWGQQSAALGHTGIRDSRSIRMLGLAIEASMMAGDTTEVARLQEKLFAVVNPFPKLWRLSPDEPRLHYELADFSMPLILGQWKLTKFEPADKRDYGTSVRYTQELTGSSLGANIWLSYNEKQRKQNSEMRQEWLKSYQDLHTAKALASSMPDLPFDGPTSVKLGKQWECDGQQCTSIHWTALRGDWRMDIDVEFRAQDKFKAEEQVRKLFAALSWHSAPNLFRQRTMAEQSRDIDSYWAKPNGTSKAAELAELAVPDAFFPDEIANLHSVIGVSQYRQGNMDAARSSFDLALSVGAYGSRNERYYRPALDYAADIAYRQGRKREAATLNRTFIEWQESDATLGWGIPDGENFFINTSSGIRLPLRVSDFRLRIGGKNRFYYENLQTRVQLGLTVGLSQSSDDKFESMLRSFMTKELRLDTGKLHKTKFSPKSSERGNQQATGRKWVFEVTELPDDKEVSTRDPATDVLRKKTAEVSFWIVDKKERRSVLGAPITSNDNTTNDVNQIAQALSW
jgi:hypothetical protein